jgi:two-component system, chemotaxis family, CheB/CheR fusion protein
MAARRKREETTTGQPSKQPASAASDPSWAAAPAGPADETAGPRRPGFAIVGIGASAGGLDAFKRFLSHMPADSGAAFVLVPHLDPTHESLMVELLARQTEMPVCEACDAVPVVPNCVYVIPPNKYLAVAEGRLQLSTPTGRHGQPTAIDFFFRSLAESQRELAIGIILSGTSSHGTLGLKEIKLAGGMVMVQHPETAEYDQMPRSAIATGLVDFELPPERMPEALVKYLRHPYVHGALGEAADAVSREHLGRILALLKVRTKYDFRSYRKTMLTRRVLRRMGLCHLEQLSDYLDCMRDNPDEVNALYRDLMIGVTGFFRDPEAFQVLQQRVIPELVAVRGCVRVWVPACASGEEAYSIAILFMEQFAAGEQPANLQVFATDIDERSLETARQGIYSASSLAGVSAERIGRFFTKIDSQRWQVNKQLRESITFAQQNLVSDAPFSKLDLISCRNLLIYLEQEVQAKVIRMFHFALGDSGYLLLGPSETIGREVDLFDPVSKKWRVFRRIGPTRRERVEIPIVASDEQRRLNPRPSAAAPAPAIVFKELMQRLILEDFAPAAALINQKFEIVSVLGPLVNYLEFPPGELTSDLLAMARPGLRTKLRAALYKAIRTGTAVTDLNARVKRDGAYAACAITVKPVAEARDAAGLLLVTFQDRGPAGRADADGRDARPADDDQTHLLQHLDHELKATREDLQSTIEEYESSTEELKASNEEVMSMNEELQSTNEELETSKEELQSLNEELSTVNSQLLEKAEELDRTNSDLLNLMASSAIATLMLDAELRIKRFTPLVAKLLNLRATDLDRPFSDFASQFQDDALLDDCRAVLERLAPIEKEVWTKDAAASAVRPGPAPEPRGGARCYLRRILPYRSVDDRIVGVVITLVDITERMVAETQARRLADVLWHSHDAITVQDFGGQIIAWNRGAERMYGYTEAEALQMNIRDTVPDNKRAEALAYVEHVIHDEPVTAFETQRLTKDGRLLDVGLTVTAYRDERGRSIGVSTTERDISERKRLTLALQQLNETLEQRVAEQTHEITMLAEAIANLGEGVVITANELDWPGPQILFVNQAMCRITGYEADELVGRTPRILYGAETDRGMLKHIKQELTAGRACLAQLANYRKDGTKYDAELFITPLFNPHGRRTNFVSIHRDISERKQIERTLHENEERMRAILNTAADAIITFDEHGIITSVNPATERMFGYVEEELLGRNVSLLMRPASCDARDAHFARDVKTGETRIIDAGREAVGRRKDGSTFPVDLAISQVDGLGLFTEVVRDISYRRKLEKRVLEIAADEQRRIGQELHDGTGGELTGLALFAGALVDLLNQAPEKAAGGEAAWLLGDAELLRLRQTARRLSQGLAEAHQHVQQLSRGIMPVQIEADGLRSALKDLAAATDAPPDIRCCFESPAPVEIADNNTATHLYRIAQEAVNNALRHSRAGEIRIFLSRCDDAIVLEVSDNGIGFDPAAAIPPDVSVRARGIGLEIMKYRAGIFGGILRVKRRDEGGTLVRCIVPEGIGHGETANASENPDRG